MNSQLSKLNDKNKYQVKKKHNYRTLMKRTFKSAQSDRSHIEAKSINNNINIQYINIS